MLFPPRLSSEHHAHLGRHVPQRAQEPRAPVPAPPGRPDADPRHLEPHAQPLPVPGDGPRQREAGLDGGLLGAPHHDGPAHP